MKKVLLALFAVLTLAACTGSYKSGNCEYDFLLHKDISISKWIGNATGGCQIYIRKKNGAICPVFYFATTTIAGRKTVSPYMYPACISAKIVFGACSSSAGAVDIAL